MDDLIEGLASAAHRMTPAEFWRDDAVTRRASAIRAGQVGHEEAMSALTRAVEQDIASGRRYGRVPVECGGISSFRAEQVEMIGLIGADYDGEGDPETGDGDPDGLASLALELFRFAVLGYANVPVLYYPVEVRSGVWTLRGTGRRADGSTPALRVDCMSCGLPPEQRGMRTPREFDEWFDAFVAARASEVAGGCVCALPCSVDGVARDDMPEIDGCVRVIEAYRRIEGGLDEARRRGDVRGLCADIDRLIAVL